MLPADFAADKDRLQRFEQEAKAPSGLNPPNVLTGIVNLNFTKSKKQRLRKTIPLSLSALIDNSLLMRNGVDTIHLFPEDESPFHHSPITASSVQMSSHSKVGGDYSEG